MRARTEVKVLDQKVARIAELREAYAHVPEITSHFRDPLRAFDEAHAPSTMAASLTSPKIWRRSAFPA